MTLDEITQEERLRIRKLRQNAESRYVECKRILEELYKSKKDMKPEVFTELVGIIKDTKSEDEWFMKQLEDEAQHLNQGLNPPFCYQKKKHPNGTISR